jgi:hypothetical protein
MGVMCLKAREEEEVDELPQNKQRTEAENLCDGGERGTVKQENPHAKAIETMQKQETSVKQELIWSNKGNRLGCPLEGIRNEGNTCFAGAALMALLANSTLVDTLRREFVSEHREVWEAFLALETQKSQVNCLLSNFSQFNDGLQHCANDFLNHIFMLLGGSNMIKPGNSSGKELFTLCRNSRNPHIFDIYALVTQTKLSCLKCVLAGVGEPMIKGTMMWSLNLPIGRTVGSKQKTWCQASKSTPNKWLYWQQLKQLYESEEDEACEAGISLLSSLKLAMGVSLLPSSCFLYCNKCLEDTQHFRQQEIVHAGSHLIIHLQRYDAALAEKDCSFLPIPLLLDLSQFTDSLGEYSLYAVICHAGGLRGGHYWVNLRSKGRWHRYDDHVHSFISDTQALDETAYVLFYKKIVKAQ